MEIKTTKEIEDYCWKQPSLFHTTESIDKWEKRNWVSVDDLIKYIKSKEWIVISCGRSTDYLEEIDIDDSIRNLIAELTENMHNKKED